MSVYSAGLTALNAAKLGIATTGHNIANVNTAGYRRQEIIQTTTSPVSTGSGFIGQGTSVDTIRRVYDQFLERQVAQNESGAAYYDQYLQNVQQLDNVMGDRDTGLSTSLQQFFQSWNDLANFPTSLPARQSVLGSAQSVVNSLDTTGSYIQSLQESTNTQISSMVSEINGFARSIAAMNDRISQVNMSGQPVNDLLDQRDQMVTELSQLTGVTILKEAATGNYNVFMGTGYQLVSGVNASSIMAKSSAYDPGRIEVYDAAGGVPLSDSALSGGKLGAMLDYRTDVLDMAQNSLGRIAITLSQSVNVQHRLGLDASGAAGQEFFNSLVNPLDTSYIAGAPTLYPDSVSNTGNYDLNTTRAEIDDPSKITTDDYLLTFDGTSWTVSHKDDGSAVTPVVVTNSPTSFLLVFEGVRLNINANSLPTGKDTFLLRPTAAAATNLRVAITDPGKIAAADASAGANGTLDNRNALAIAGLQSNGSLIEGRSTIEGGYGLLVGAIGNITSETKVNNLAQNSLLAQTKNAQQAASGVNLDEEAANLIRYQQSYQAAAQIIKTASTMFDTLLTLGG